MVSRPAFSLDALTPRHFLCSRSTVATCNLITLCLLFTCAANAADTVAGTDKYAAPSSYQARTDRRVQAYPDTTPQPGPAGSVFTDPSFGSRMTRITDEKTDNGNSGKSFQTPASAQANIWNTESTKFYVIESGGHLLFYDFDTTKMTSHRSDVANLGWRPEPEFSYRLPNIVYGLSDGAPQFQQYDFESRKVSTIHDPKNCLKLTPNDHGADISVSADDSRFMGVFGPRQNDNYLVYIYDREKGCRWFNTQTGEIGGQWGAKGKISGVDSFSIHDARISKGGDFVVITGGGQGPIVWELATLSVILCTRSNPMACGGHHAVGYSHMVNPSGRRHPMELLVRPLNNLSKTTDLLPELKEHGVWYDKHLSWNNDDADDGKPVCLSNYTSENPTAKGAALKSDGPWTNEIDCIETDGKDSRVWRFAHHYSSAKNGFWSTPRGNVSQDGNFFAFTSDWENTLGVGEQGSRHDVFVVELK